MRREIGQSYALTCAMYSCHVYIFILFRQKQTSPERMPRRESVAKPEALTNGKYGPLPATQDVNFGILSSESADSYDDKEDHENDNLDRRCVFFVSFKYVEMFLLKSNFH